jgi:hypothetical protein
VRIVIGADHGGYELKQQIAEFLIAQGHQVQDLGTHSPESVDYPDFAALLARAVVAEGFERGILVCGTGIGMSIAANKVRGARAAVCTDCYMAHLAREHNRFSAWEDACSALAWRWTSCRSSSVANSPVAATRGALTRSANWRKRSEVVRDGAIILGLFLILRPVVLP